MLVHTVRAPTAVVVVKVSAVLLAAEVKTLTAVL